MLSIARPRIGLGLRAAQSYGPAVQQVRFLKGQPNDRVRPLIPDAQRMLPAYITPPRSSLPSWLSFRNRWQYTRRWIGQFVRSTIMVGMMKRSLASGKYVPKEKFNFGQFPQRAMEKYIGFNTALAKGNIETLRLYATDTYVDSLKKEIRARSPLKTYNWELLDTVQPPKTVAVALARMDSVSKQYLMQITLRIHTRQKLTVQSPGSQPQEIIKEIIEYPAFERMLWLPGQDFAICGKHEEFNLEQAIARRDQAAQRSSNQSTLQ